MKWILLMLLPCLTAVASAEQRRPTPQDVVFGGRVTAVRDSDALLGGSVQLDDPVSGAYELAGPRSNELSIFAPAVVGALEPPTIERIDYGSRCGDLAATLGSAAVSPLSAHGIDVETTDFAAGEGTDLYSMRGSGFLPGSAPGLPFDIQIELLLRDSSGEAAMLSQPLPLPGDLAAWESATLTIVGCAFGSQLCPSSSPRFEIEAVIDTLASERSDTCLVVDLEGFDGELRFKQMKDVLEEDTAPASVDSALIRSDGSLRLRIDPMTELAGQLTRIKIGTKNVRRRFEIASESEGALLAYIEREALELGADIVAEASDKPATVEWLQPHNSPEASLELRASFLYLDPEGDSRKGKLLLDVSQPAP